MPSWVGEGWGPYRLAALQETVSACSTAINRPGISLCSRGPEIVLINLRRVVIPLHSRSCRTAKAALDAVIVLNLRAKILDLPTDFLLDAIDRTRAARQVRSTGN
jgi:hypothetical protein